MSTMVLPMLIRWIDGEHDWMDPKGGEASVEALRRAGNPNAKMYIVNDAGHHGEARSKALAH